MTWPLRVEVLTIDRALNQRSAVLQLRHSGSAAVMGSGRRTILPRANRPGDLTGVEVPAVSRDVTAMNRWQGQLVAGTLVDGLWRVDDDTTGTDQRRWRRLALDAADGVALDRRLRIGASSGCA